jgi:hypothetical protein
MRHLVDTDWAKLDRLTTYYLNRDWLHFDEAITDLMPPEALDFHEEWIRDDRLHRLYGLFFAAMLALSPPEAPSRTKDIMVRALDTDQTEFRVHDCVRQIREHDLGISKC